MDPSVIVLILTGIFALLGFGFIVAAFLVSENKLKNINSGTGTTGTTGNTGNTCIYCTTPGIPPLVSAPSFTRTSRKSTAVDPLSTLDPNFDSVTHSVQKLYRTRSLKEPVSPNHWLGNAMYGEDNIFLLYPYFGTIKDDSFLFSWPGTGTLEEKCLTTTCPTGNADLFYNVSPGPSLEIGSSGSKWLSCDIVDIDALVSTVVWQYENTATGKTGSITIPLAKGCPFITAEITNIETTLSCNQPFDIKSTQGGSVHQIEFIDGSGFIIYLSTPLTLGLQFGIIVIPRITGTIRIAYYNSPTMLGLLADNYQIYPIESTISTKASGVGIDGSICSNLEECVQATSWNVDTSFVWTTRNMTTQQNGQELLMVALPHHNITNSDFESLLFDHPVLGPFRFVTTSNNMWNLADAVANYQFEYPPINATGSTGSTGSTDLMIELWNNDISHVTMLNPEDTVDWMRWLGSIAILMLIGNMLKQDISHYKKLLETQLNLIREKRGVVSPTNTLVYDKTWCGTISNLGLTNCMGNSDDGNAFYEAHIGQFGYLVFAYAVAGYFNPDFININRETVLFFVRNIANPYEFDKSFPLWRNKDWYFGYSQSSGLSPGQSNGKNTTNIAENILGYYGVYLVSQVLAGDQSELLNWSLGMLAAEIASSQYYFQFSANNAITVDPAFVQGTITDRGDTYYAYTVVGGNSMYPERNASIMIPMLKPLTLMSFDYINNQWATGQKQWLNPAITNNTQPESLAYALATLSVNSDESILQQIINEIMEEQNVFLPYGSTWSSILYWVLNQI